MKVTLLAVGRAKAPFDRAEAHYLKLLRRIQPVEVAAVKDDEALARRFDPDAHNVALDAGGEQMDSIAWSRWLDRRRHAGRKLTLLVGGAEGLPPELLARCDERISLGPQTMAHQLARVVLLEQVFRAAKILAGERYHL